MRGNPSKPCPSACLLPEQGLVPWGSRGISISCVQPNLHPRKLGNSLAQTLGQGSPPGGYVRSVNRQSVQYQEILHTSKGPAFPMPFDISSKAFIDRMVQMAQSGAHVFRRCLTYRPWPCFCADLPPRLSCVHSETNKPRSSQSIAEVPCRSSCSSSLFCFCLSDIPHLAQNRQGSWPPGPRKV